MVNNYLKSLKLYYIKEDKNNSKMVNLLVSYIGQCKYNI